MTVHNCAGGRRVVSGALGVALALAVPTGSAAANTDSVTCQKPTHIVVSPPLTFTKQHHTFYETAQFTSCSDGVSGTLEADGGTIDGSCAGGFGESKGWTVKWSDGTTSVGVAAGDVIPPFVITEGKILKGRFAGRTWQFRALVAPEDPQKCFGSGVTEADVNGLWTFK